MPGFMGRRSGGIRHSARIPAIGTTLATAVALCLTLAANAGALTLTTKLVSAPGAGASGAPADAYFGRIAAHGTRVFFGTPENLVAADTDGLFDVYKRSGAATTLVSVPGTGANGAPGDAFFRGASADGSRVFFETTQNLVGADTDGLGDVYERSGGTTTLVSAPGAGASGAAADAGFAGASADGTRVFFNTAESLVGTDTDGLTDIYKRSGGTTRLVSAPGAGASGAADDTLFGGTSADGTRVFFITTEKLVGADTDNSLDTYERSGGTTKLVSAPGAGASGTVYSAPFRGASADGTRVFFETRQKLVGADRDGRYDVYERSGGTTKLVSAPGAGHSSVARAAFFSGASADGTRVFFETYAKLVGADREGPGQYDVYERSGGTTKLVSARGSGHSGGAQNAYFDGTSANGRRVFFLTYEKLVRADTDGLGDVYERSGGTTKLVSARGSGHSGAAQNAYFDGTSANGRRVFFDTFEKLVGADRNHRSDVYERSAGTTKLVSARGSGHSGAAQSAYFDGTSANGKRVFFSTNENLVGADVDGQQDIYERSAVP